MVILDLKLYGIYGFEDFEINFTYPKKIVNSIIEDEHLTGRKNFRYKKAIILMGANATGKTSLARALHGIFTLFEFGFTNDLIDMATKEKSSFTIDFVNEDYTLRRFEGIIDINNLGFETNEYTAYIGINDSYEVCVEKLKKVGNDRSKVFSYGSLHEKINYYFSYPDAKKRRNTKKIDQNMLLKTLKAVLGTMDPSLEEVIISKDLKDSFVVKRKETEIVIQS